MKKLATLAVLPLLSVLTVSYANSDLQTSPAKMKQEASDSIQRGQLLQSEFVVSISKDNINKYFPERKTMQGNIDDVPKYDIDLYKITYSSVHDGKSVKLSGLVVVPKKQGELYHLQYHHGTLYPYPAKDGWGSLDVPSLYQGDFPKTHKASYETRLNGNYLGSYGYLVSLPDYAGYGVSENLEHPYSVNPQLAQQSVDMILATQAFAKKQQLPLKQGTFLSGWSEGGAISVATQKLIEQDYAKRIKLLANAPMSGMLNTAGLGEGFKHAPTITQDLGEGMDFLAWTYYAYNKFSDNPIATDKIFKMPVNNQLDILKNRPSSKPSEVFKPLADKDLQHLITQAKNSNLASGWSPVAPLFIHHGTADTTVPFANNPEVALAYYKKHGGNASLTKYEGHEHETLGLLQMKNMLADFEAVKNQ